MMEAADPIGALAGAEFPELRKRYWGRHFWARGYFCTTSGNITDDVILQYIRSHEPTGTRQDLRAVTKKCRPDWDITTPELKAAWEQGRKELFYPYGKTYAQSVNRTRSGVRVSKAADALRSLMEAGQNAQVATLTGFSSTALR